MLSLHVPARADALGALTSQYALSDGFIASRAPAPRFVHQMNKPGFCWLGVIGPTAAWALRRLALPLLACPEAHEVDLSVLATELGLGHSAAKAQAALDRLARFGLARWAGIGELEVVTAVPLLPRRHLGHLSAWARRYHDQALAGVAGTRRAG